MTATDVAIGFETLDQDGAAFGFEGASTGDYRQMHDILLAWVNDKGGYGGRNVRGVFYDANQYTVAPDAAAQAECTYFTQDQEVFAVSTFWHGENFRACIADAGLPHLNTSSTSYSDREALNGLPRWFDSVGGVVDVATQAYVDGIAQLGYFSPGAVVGLLLTDVAPARRTRERVLEPALAQRGVEIAEEYVFGPMENPRDFSAASSQVGAAVLRMRAAGVTHVLFQDPSSSNMALLFMNAAEAQAYRPRYASTGDMGIGHLHGLGFLPEAQLQGVVGVGWTPSFDVTFEQDEPPKGPGRQLCEQIFARAGFTFPDENAKAHALLLCDQHLFHKTVFDRIDGPPTATAYVAAAEGLGERYAGALIPRTRFGPGRHTAPTEYRLVSWTEACRCFRYVSPPRPLPA